MNPALKTTIKKILYVYDRFSPLPLFFPFMMTDGEKRLFDSVVSNSSHYLEFGMGGSTFRALKKSNAQVYSIDSSISWIGYMRSFLFIRMMENKRLSLFHVDIGETGEFGHPKNQISKEKFIDYSSSIFESIDKTKVDTVLVDGRFRVACTLKTIMECQENDSLSIMIHDFHREYYHPVLKFLDIKSRVDNLVVCEIREGLEIEVLETMYEQYKDVSD